MGVEGVDAMTQEEYRKAACDAVRKLGQDVGIPADLKAIVKDEDVQFLAESAFADACRPGNPRRHQCGGNCRAVPQYDVKQSRRGGCRPGAYAPGCFFVETVKETSFLFDFGRVPGLY